MAPEQTLLYPRRSNIHERAAPLRPGWGVVYGTTVSAGQRGTRPRRPRGRCRVRGRVPGHALVRGDRPAPGRTARRSPRRVVDQREGRVRERARGVLVRRPCPLYDQARRPERRGRSADDQRVHGCHGGPRGLLGRRPVRPFVPERAGQPALRRDGRAALSRPDHDRGGARTAPRRLRPLRGVRPARALPADDPHLPLEGRRRARPDLGRFPGSRRSAATPGSTW